METNDKERIEKYANSRFSTPSRDNSILIVDKKAIMSFINAAEYERTIANQQLAENDKEWLSEIKNLMDGFEIERSRLKEALRKYKEYIEFLNEANAAPISSAYAHGWRCPQSDVDKGIKLREEIENLLK